jgi:hypothetical protein
LIQSGCIQSNDDDRHEGMLRWGVRRCEDNEEHDILFLGPWMVRSYMLFSVSKGNCIGRATALASHSRSCMGWLNNDPEQEEKKKKGIDKTGTGMITLGSRTMGGRLRPRRLDSCYYIYSTHLAFDFGFLLLCGGWIASLRR